VVSVVWSGSTVSSFCLSPNGGAATAALHLAGHRQVKVIPDGRLLPVPSTHLPSLALPEDPHSAISSMAMLFFVVAAPTSCACRHLMSELSFSGFILSTIGPFGPLLDAFPRVMLLCCRDLAHALLRVAMLSPWSD